MDSGLVNKNMKYKKTTAGILGGLTLFGGGTVVDNQINPYTDKDTHYELSVKSDIPQNDRVEIAKDKPSVTLSRWNDEERVTIEPKFRGAGKISKANRSLFSKKMEFTKGAITAFVEPKTETEFDIDFTLEGKPTYNVFEYTIIGAENMDFFYQPALTQKEIDEGSVRPDNVIGSYAVYSKTKANHCTNCIGVTREIIQADGTSTTTQIIATNYATGKLLHIYRPEAIDADGNRVWAVLDYKNGVLSVTVPQEFLDNAVYPVRVDPTFGYTSVGSTEGALSAGTAQFNGSNASVSTEAGTVSKLTFYGYRPGAAPDVKGVISQTSDHIIISNGVANSVSVANAVGQWWDTSFGTPPSITAQNYHLSMVTNGTLIVFYDSSSDAGWRDTTNSYTTPTNPTDGALTAWNLSIYATYTASGGGGTSSSAESFWDDI